VEIGIKLDIGFAGNDAYRCLYGDGDILEFLYDSGVRAVETPVGVDTDEHELMEHVRKCCEAGFRVSFHPYTERTPANPAFFDLSEANPCCELHERFFRLAAIAAELQDRQATVNIHPAAELLELSRDELVEQSVRFFQWAGRWCKTNTPAVHPVAELQIRPNPEEDIQRIGDRYEELLEIVERSDTGACWDFGHAVMNSRRFGDSLEPPPQLLHRIAHVHCHDIDVEDHQQLIFGNVPWDRFLRHLVNAGFDGTVILEVPPEFFIAAGGIDTLTHSIHVLAAWQ